MKFFYFLFFHSYRLAIMMGNEGFYPDVNAWFFATLFPWLNIMSILIFLKNNYFISKEVYNYCLEGSFLLWIVSFIYCIVKIKYNKVLLTKGGLNFNSKSKTVLFYSYILVSGIIYFGVLSR